MQIILNLSVASDPNSLSTSHGARGKSFHAGQLRGTAWAVQGDSGQRPLTRGLFLHVVELFLSFCCIVCATRLCGFSSGLDHRSLTSWQGLALTFVATDEDEEAGRRKKWVLPLRLLGSGLGVR